MFTKLKKSLKKSDEGFTIIEVMIVLAIAGLILLIVFLAVPALQRNSRNTQAKNEAANILGAESEFSSNNNGKIPATSVSSCAASPGCDARTVFGNAKTTTLTTLTVEPEAGTIVPTGTMAVLRTGAKCNAANNETDPGTTRQVALLYQIEDSSGAKITCQEG